MANSSPGRFCLQHSRLPLRGSHCVLALFFPLFFGLIVGDIGYGLAIAAIALLLPRSFPPRSQLRDLLTVVLYSSGVALLFGVAFGELFGTLTRAVSASAPVALVGAFVWGVISVILRPCHLASIPLIVGFISQQEKITTRKAFRISLAFALGILVTIGVIGVVTSLLGRMLGDIGRWSNYLVAAIFLLVGFYLLGIIKLDLPGAANAKARGKGDFQRYTALIDKLGIRRK